MHRIISKRGTDKMPDYSLFQFTVDNKTIIYKSTILGDKVGVGGEYTVLFKWDGKKENLSGKVLAMDGKILQVYLFYKKRWASLTGEICFCLEHSQIFGFLYSRINNDLRLLSISRFLYVCELD